MSGLDEARVEDRLCTCYPGGVSPAAYEGPQEWCDLHGLPSAAYALGLRNALVAILAAGGAILDAYQLAHYLGHTTGCEKPCGEGHHRVVTRVGMPATFPPRACTCGLDDLLAALPEVPQ